MRLVSTKQALDLASRKHQSPLAVDDADDVMGSPTNYACVDLPPAIAPDSILERERPWISTASR